MISLSINLNAPPKGDCAELYLYLDESGTPSLKDDDPFSVGSVITPTPIPEDFFHDSFNLLRNDPGLDQKDKKTLQRGYYHASIDGPNAHSHCCRAIHSMPSAFEFWWNYYDKEAIENSQRILFNKSSLHHDLLVAICAHYLPTQTKKLNLHVAERPGSFSQGTIEAWQKKFIESALNVIINNPLMPVIVPELQIEIGSPDQVGVQLVDFILWAAQRRKFRSEAKWLERLGVKEFFSLNDPEMALSFEHFYHKNELTGYLSDSLINVKDDEIEGLLRGTEFINVAMVKIENAIRLIGGKYLDKVSNKLLANRVVLLNKRIERGGFSIAELDELCRLFVLLVDDIPLYSESDKKDITHAYAAKRLCCRTLNEKEPNRNGLVKRWLALREMIIANHQHGSPD